MQLCYIADFDYTERSVAWLERSKAVCQVNVQKIGMKRPYTGGTCNYPRQAGTLTYRLELRGGFRLVTDRNLNGRNGQAMRQDSMYRSAHKICSIALAFVFKHSTCEIPSWLQAIASVH